MMNETEERERIEYPCPVTDAPCEHYAYVCDSNGEVAICHCGHPRNSDVLEGNCRASVCPLAG